MAYIKTDWEDGDVISEAGLDHLENGVYNNSVAIGDLADLDTTDKTNLVAAINEAAQSGGGSGGMSNAVKDALLQLASKVAYIDDDGQDYYDDLYDALYPAASIVSIQADYTQTGTVYPTTSLEDLRNDLAVSAIYDNGSVVPVISYTLSGTLTVGESTITVTYSGFTDTFEVTVTAVPTVTSIAAVYTQSGTVYDTDSLDSLKADLVVTATYSDSSTATVPSADYTLSGTLAVGTSTITVSYESKTTTFSVTVSEKTLPSDYQAVAYIQSTGAEYIDTGIYGDLDTEVEMKVNRLSALNIAARLFGARVGTSTATYDDGLFISTRTSSGNGYFYAQMDNCELRPQTNWPRNTDIVLKFNKNGAYIDDVLTYSDFRLISNNSQQGTPSAFTTAHTMGLFNAKQAGTWGTNGMSAKLYSIEITKNGTTVFEGIPCYRKADSVVGLFDMVSMSFLENISGSGAFVAGGDV